jgi:hypothetical protein
MIRAHSMYLDARKMLSEFLNPVLSFQIEVAGFESYLKPATANYEY